LSFRPVPVDRGSKDTRFSFGSLWNPTPCSVMVVVGNGQSISVLLSRVTHGQADSTCELSCVVVSTTESDSVTVTDRDVLRERVPVSDIEIVSDSDSGSVAVGDGDPPVAVSDAERLIVALSVSVYVLPVSVMRCDSVGVPMDAVCDTVDVSVTGSDSDADGVVDGDKVTLSDTVVVMVGASDKVSDPDNVAVADSEVVAVSANVSVLVSEVDTLRVRDRVADSDTDGLADRERDTVAVKDSL